MYLYYSCTGYTSCTCTLYMHVCTVCIIFGSHAVHKLWFTTPSTVPFTAMSPGCVRWLSQTMKPVQLLLSVFTSSPRVHRSLEPNKALLFFLSSCSYPDTMLYVFDQQVCMCMFDFDFTLASHMCKTRHCDYRSCTVVQVFSSSHPNCVQKIRYTQNPGLKPLASYSPTLHLAIAALA